MWMLRTIFVHLGHNGVRCVFIPAKVVGDLDLINGLSWRNRLRLCLAFSSLSWPLAKCVQHDIVTTTLPTIAYQTMTHQLEGHPMSAKPKILVQISPSLYDLLFTPDSQARLAQVAELTFNREERRWDSSELAQRLPGFDAVITGWGTPKFTGEVLDSARRLRLVAHSAGSIKHMLPPELFAQGVAVTHAASAIAPAVADISLLLIMLCLRRVHILDRMMKAGASWEEMRPIGMGQEIAAQRIGVIGAGYTGRCLIGMLTALNAEVWVHDPYLSEARAAELGVQQAGMDDLFAQCTVVTVQAPTTQETHRMIGAKQLARLRDGGVFVNTARSLAVDQDALLAELQSGRIVAALDVFDEEPLPADHPFLRLENVITTPHVAGASVQARQRQGQVIVDEIESFFGQESLRYEVTAAMLQTMA
jgi:phosphoglycerate dehydrogenase-like enzyme